MDRVRVSTMKLVPEVVPAVLKTLQGVKLPPVPMRVLLRDTALMASINQVRLNAGLNETYFWPDAKHLLEKTLQFLRKRGDIRSTPQGWCLNGTIIEPAETLSDVEYRALVELLKDGWPTKENKPLVNKVLRAVRHMKW